MHTDYVEATLPMAPTDLHRAPLARLPVCVAMIAGAEAARIGRALKSVAAWTSEIVVVVNEEVSDGTDRIAENYGARVFREPWKGFVAQKNSAAAKATQPWILGLDADEEVSEPLREDIRTALRPSEGNAPFVAYRFPRCTRFCGRWIRHGDWYPDCKVFLWRRGRGRWGGLDPHASLQIDGPVGRLRGDLLHYTADTIDRQVAKIPGYSDGFAAEMRARGKRVGWLDYLVRPPWRFVRAYLLRLGFLDGWQGYYIAWMTAFYTATRYAKALDLQARPPGEGAERSTRP